MSSLSLSLYIYIYIYINRLSKRNIVACHLSVNAYIYHFGFPSYIDI